MKVKLYGTKNYMKWVGEYYGTVGNNFYYDNSELLDKNNRFDINKNLYPKVCIINKHNISNDIDIMLQKYVKPKLVNSVTKTENIFLKEVDICEDILTNNREYSYGDYTFSALPIYDFKDECYVLNVGCVENVQLNNKEDIIADFNYIVESINQLNDINYNEIQNEIEKVKEQYNNCNSNNARLFTKIKNLFKNK